MKFKLFTAFILAPTLFTSHVQAQESGYAQAEQWRGCYKGSRLPAAVVNHENITIASNSGKAIKAEQVKQAIQQAAAEQQWTISPQANSKLLATYSKRGKHTIVVEIAYAADKYSIRYKDSTNMHHVVCDGQGVIHPYYNTWVTNLKTAIQSKLMAL